MIGTLKLYKSKFKLTNLADHQSHCCSVDSLQPHGLQHARLPCPSLSLRVYPNSCPLSQWCHPTISSSVAPFSSCLQSSPASGSFPVSWLFASGGRIIGASASASVLPMNILGWFHVGWTGLVAFHLLEASGAKKMWWLRKYSFSAQFFWMKGMHATQ